MNGFVDLRRSSGPESIHDSFWPSFTDVMMVVVMIFIMASLILVVKNWDLVAELRATIRAEREAQEFAQSTDATNKTLSERLAEAQHHLSELRMELMRVSEESLMKSRFIDERDKRLLAVNADVRKLTERLRVSESTVASVNDELARVRTELAQLEDMHSAQAARVKSLREKYARLQGEHQSRLDELSELRQVRSQSEHLLTSLQGEYDALKVRYDKLVRPARTAQGKHVVDVLYEKTGDHYHIKYKDPGDQAYTDATRQVLDSHLAQLKADHPGKLYIKIIIPADSGLSYTEAWQFTASVLARYDYYHQE